MVSDHCQVRALADLGCGQDPEIAGAFILRRDRIDKSLEWPQRATIDPDKAVVVVWGLYREGRLIDDGKPSPTRRVEPFVEGTPVAVNSAGQSVSSGGARKYSRMDLFCPTETRFSIAAALTSRSAVCASLLARSSSASFRRF